MVEHIGELTVLSGCRLGMLPRFKRCTIQLNVQIEKEHDWREQKSGKSLPNLRFRDHQDSMHHWSRLLREVYRWKLLIVHSSSLYSKAGNINNFRLRQEGANGLGRNTRAR